MSATDALGASWRKLADRYAAIKQREQILVAAAVIVAIGFLGFSWWVDPAAQRLSNLRKQMSGQQTELATLRAQIAGMQSQLHDPDAAARKALADLEARLIAVSEQLGSLDDKLVPPQRMGDLLQTVLARHRGLTLIGVRSLPPEPVLTPAAGKEAAGKTPAPARETDKVPAVGENLYRHGLEIRVAGSYADLLAYVADLERAPQRLLWREMTLTAKDYPLSELTLKVNTLSRDMEWLAV